MGMTGRMGGFLRGLDAWLEREPDVSSEAAEEARDDEPTDGTDERENEPEGDAQDAAYDASGGYTVPASIAH